MTADTRRSRTAPSVTRFRMILSTLRLARRMQDRVCRVLGLGLVMLLAAPSTASAQGRLDARYEVTLSGIPVGRGVWNIDISDDQFSASASGGSTGLLHAFSGGSGTGAAQGRVVGGALVSTNYS